MKAFDFVKAGPALGISLAVAVLALAGCGESGNGGETSEAQAVSPAAQPMSAEVQSHVDQGNTAQREGDYQLALEHYQAAMELDPEHPIPQFGALMAAMAAGDTALASSLSAKLEATAPELLTMLNPDGSMGGMPADPHAGGEGAMPGMPPAMGGSGEGALPPGHPSLDVTLPDTLQPDTTGR